MDNEQVYIVISQKFSVDLNTPIYIKDIGEVYSSNPTIKKEVENLRVHNGGKEEDWAKIAAIDIIEKVLKYKEKLNITMLGQDEVILEIKSQEKKRPIFEFIKVLFICIVLFFGASIAIINFHVDVNMDESISKLYYTITGEQNDNPILMTIPYTVGLGLGMFMFFNRVFSSSRRRRKEPGPMEIELYLYDQDLEAYIANDMKNEEKRLE